MILVSYQMSLILERLVSTEEQGISILFSILTLFDLGLLGLFLGGELGVTSFEHFAVHENN